VVRNLMQVCSMGVSNHFEPFEAGSVMRWICFGELNDHFLGDESLVARGERSPTHFDPTTA